MRIDKFLKVSRIIKRRTIAQEIVAAGRVFKNDAVLKPSYNLKVGDEFTIKFAKGDITYRVLLLNDKVQKEGADTLYEIV